MIKFTHIDIQNFYSIEHLSLDLQNGIHKLSGGNGVGKTSISSAITQCLYNKNPKSNGAINNTYNYVTGKAYKIELKFEKDNDKFVVVNDRGTNTISISKNGIPVSAKGIKAQLQNIQKIIGLDYETFLSITYLNQNSISSIFDLTDSTNLVNKFFDIDLIKYLEKQLKVERREGRKHLLFIETQSKDNMKTIEALDKYVQEDTTEYKEQLRSKLDLLAELSTGETIQNINILDKVLQKEKAKQHCLEEPVLLLKGEYETYKKQLEQFSSGTCPLCGASVSDDQNKLEKLSEKTKEQLIQAKEKLNTQKEKVEGLSLKYTKLQKKYDNETSVVKETIAKLKSKIKIIEEKNKQLKQIQKDKDNLIAKQQDLVQVIEEKRNLLLFIESALGVISSGSITKQYINTFITILNNKLQSLINGLDLPLVITVIEDEGDIKYIINNNGEETSYSTLSSGERTRVSLVVLLGIIETLEVLTNVQVNVLIFDELLSVLDTEGVEIFQQQLNKYRETKSVFVVIHHDEIPTDYFDSICNVYKVDNLTKLEVIV